MKRICTHLTEPQIARLKKIGKKTGIKPSELIRRAVDMLISSSN